MKNLKKENKKMKHESNYHNPVLLYMIEKLHLTDFWCEVKKCTGNTFYEKQIRLKQKAMLNNPNPVGIHIPDVAMDTGGSRALDLVCATHKYLAIVYLENNKPYFLLIKIIPDTLFILKKNTKLDELKKLSPAYPL